MLMRYLWAAPTTLVGLAVATLALHGGRLTCVDGVIEAHGPLLRWALSHLTLLPGGVAAITLGHVVIATDARALERTRTHERVHVGQYERWGPFFVPAYAAASLWAFARGRHPYFDNAFEREAGRLLGSKGSRHLTNPPHPPNLTNPKLARSMQMSRGRPPHYADEPSKLDDGGEGVAQ
jgi:hypothetical protein